MSTLDVVEYYGGLLIIQYIGKPKAQATIQAQITPFIQPQVTVQVISFSAVPTSGTYKLNWDEDITAAIDWDDDATAVQTAIRTLTGLETVTVTGSTTLGFTVTFVGVEPVAALLTVSDNTLLASATAVEVTVTETDTTLPIAIQNGFNLTGDNVATGAQLDILGEYVGVTRTGQGFSTQIVLDDTDFLSLINMAIIKNNAGSSLATIQELLHQFFPDQLLVFDYQNMQMSYLVSTAVGSQELVQMFVVQGLLPKPMAVGVALLIYAPDITNFFGFRTYDAEAFNASPFNSYDDYRLDWPWMSYSYAIGA